MACSDAIDQYGCNGGMDVAGLEFRIRDMCCTSCEEQGKIFNYSVLSIPRKSKSAKRSVTERGGSPNAPRWDQWGQYSILSGNEI